MAKFTVTEEFRASMGWLHTWAGVATSCLLFMIFWMGSLAVFDREIDQWMKPEMRVSAPAEKFSYGKVFDQLRSGEAKDATRIFVNAPSEREPLVYTFYATPDGEFVRGQSDPATGEPIELTDSHAGTGFYYPFHYSLHIPAGIGYWVVGFCAMAMLVLMVSGIFIHRKIIKDFFTFRPKKALRRSTLDLHNMSSLMALPLHILFPLTGLMIFFSIYLPWSPTVVFGGDEDRQFAEAFAFASVEPSGEPSPAEIDMDAIIAQVESNWALRSPGSVPKADAVGLELANDANAYAMVREVFPSRSVSMNKNITAISVSDREVLSDVGTGPAKSTYAWLAGAHFIQFDSWALRWLYFAGGLLGSLMIASGLMFWMQARIRKGAVEPRSVRIVRGLAIGSISGIILASGVYLIANRLIPVGSSGFGMGRANFEVLFFYLVWIGTFVHAAIRGKFAWREQSLAIVPTAIFAVLLNWVTTGHHPIAAYQAGLTQIWSMDLTLLGGAGMAWFAAVRLKVSDEEAASLKAELDRTEVDALIPPEAMPAE
ncbi:MAG: PepSY-associated TM helix domain-containing protein [Pseudomonadota bacterium]